MVQNKTLIGALIAGIIIGLIIGYAAHTAPAGQVAPTTITVTKTNTNTATVTRTVTSTTTKTLAPHAHGYTEHAKHMEEYEEYTVKLAYSKKYGLYLVDAKGRTLYFFAKDYNGSSACYGMCAKKWPVFYVENLKVGPGLNPDDFKVITRKDGLKQITYKGWPLYYFVGDKKPGDINGDGVKNVWFVAKPDYTVLVAIKPGLGAYLVDSEGRTLYFFAKDAENVSKCYGRCAVNWPPFEPHSLVVPSILDLTSFKFIKRSDGGIQLSYKGHPLYYFIKDQKRGDTLGHGVKNLWVVAYINGTSFNIVKR